MNKIRIIICITIYIAACCVFGAVTGSGFGTVTVYGAQAQASFGSDSYSTMQGEEFDVGVYLNSEEEIGAYRLSLEYDADVLEYVSGADESAEGQLTISGETETGQMRRMLRFRLRTDESSYLCIRQEDVEAEPVWAPVLAAGADDGLELLSLTTAPAVIDSFQPGQRVYTMQLSKTGELQSVEAQAADGIQVTVPDTAELKVGKNILTVRLEDGNGSTGRYYLLVDIEEKSAALPMFSYEGQEWQILDSTMYAEAYLSMPYATATYGIDGVGVDFICNENREVFLVFAASPDQTASLFAYNLNDSTYYQCDAVTTDRQTYYKIPVSALVALPSGYSASILASQGIFAGLDAGGNIGLYEMNRDGEFGEYRLGDRQEENTERAESDGEDQQKGPVLVIFAVILLIAVAGLVVAYRRLSNPAFLMGAAAAGILVVVLIVVQLTPAAKTETSGNVGDVMEQVMSSETVSIGVLDGTDGTQEDTETESEEPEPTDDDNEEPDENDQTPSNQNRPSNNRNNNNTGTRVPSNPNPGGGNNNDNNSNNNNNNDNNNNNNNNDNNNDNNNNDQNGDAQNPGGENQGGNEGGEGGDGGNQGGNEGGEGGDGGNQGGNEGGGNQGGNEGGEGGGSEPPAE